MNMNRLYALGAVLLLVAYWVTAYEDTNTYLAVCERRRRVWSRIARFCGERAIDAELEYHSILETSRTWS